MASLFKRRTRNGKLTSHWYASWKDHRGKFKTRSTGVPGETEAKKIAERWENEDGLVREGHREYVDRLPMRALLNQYELKLSATDNTLGHVNETLRMILAFADEAAWKTAAEIEVNDIAAKVVRLKSEGNKPRTIQAYIRAVKGFTRWLVAAGKLPADPLASVKAPTPGKGNRRMLLPDEWRHLEAATAVAERFGMSGPERVLLYRVAIETGLRANELRELTRASLASNSTRPYIVAVAGSTKNRKRAQQYIGADLALSLRSHVARKTPTVPLFALPTKFEMADMLREDLAAARKAWVDDARRDPEERLKREQSDFLTSKNHAGQVLDFHALRHTCGAWLVLAGVSLNVVQKVMRHSTITLTIDTYGHILPGAEADAVDELSEFFTSTDPQQIETRKTGTDDAPVDGGALNAHEKLHVTREPHAGDTHGTAGIDEKNAPCWTRTNNLLIKSQLLCQLS